MPLANAKSSILEEKKPDAARMYVHAFHMYSDGHVLGLPLGAGVIALCCAVLCCAVLAVLL